jgi:hypothetical protein
MSPESHPLREPSPHILRGNVDVSKETLTDGERNAYDAFMSFELQQFKKRSGASPESRGASPYLPELAYDFVSTVVERTNTRNTKAGMIATPLVDATKVRASIARLHEKFDNADPDEVHQEKAREAVSKHFWHAQRFRTRFTEIKLATQLFEASRKLGDDRVNHAFELLIAAYGLRFEFVSGVGSSATSRHNHSLVKHPGEKNDY